MKKFKIPKEKWIALGLIILIFSCLVFWVVPQHNQALKKERAMRTGFGLFISKTQDQKLALATGFAKESNKRLLSAVPTQAVDDPSLEEVCEGMGEIADYWMDVASGNEPNPIPEIIEALQNNPDSNAVRNLLTMFANVGWGYDPFEDGTEMDDDGDTIYEVDIEELIEFLQNLDLWEMANTVSDSYDELCWEFQDEWGSGSGGMGSGSY